MPSAIDPAPARTVRRVLVYRLGSLGDTVVALPCLHRVAQAFPAAERILLTNVPVQAKAAPMAQILGGSGLVHRTLAYPVGTRSPAALWALGRQLRALAPEVLVYLTPPRGLAACWRDLAYFRACGVRHVVGAPWTPARQRNAPQPDGSVERECARLARCLGELGPIDLADPRAWDLRLSPAERAAGTAALGPALAQPRLAINMGGKVARNDWGEPRWTQLLARLAPRFGDHALVIVGGAEDAPRAARLAAQWPGPAVSLCGRLAPRESAAALAGARLFIGHDSGPLHLAAAMGVPCIGLFGDNNRPRKWHPVGPQHRLLHDLRGVQAIEVDAVAQAAAAQLQAAAAARAPRPAPDAPAFARERAAP